MLYSSWDTARDKCHNYFLFWTIFCPLPPPPPQYQSEKMKKTKKWKKQKNEKNKMPGDAIILQKCTKNHDMLCYWDMVHDGCNYFSFYPNQQNIYPTVYWKQILSEAIVSQVQPTFIY